MNMTSTTSTTNKSLTSSTTEQYKTSSSINEYVTTIFTEMTKKATTYDETNALTTRKNLSMVPNISLETTSEKTAKRSSSRNTSHITLNITLKGTEVSQPHRSTKRTKITSDKKSMCNHCSKTSEYLFYVIVMILLTNRL